MSWIANIIGGAKNLVSGGLPWATMGIIAALTGSVLYGVHIVKANTKLESQIVTMQHQHDEDVAAIDMIKARATQDLRSVSLPVITASFWILCILRLCRI